jgi:heme exporter protein D
LAGGTGTRARCLLRAAAVSGIGHDPRMGTDMVWSSVGEFIHMGGYGLYVWGSVLVTFGFMAAECVLIGVRRRTIVDFLGRVRDANNGGDDEAQA